VATSRREQAKGARRDRILEAAHDLLREVDVESVTVKAIAARAGLSAATVYNLFGTKAAILSGVFDLDLVTFETRVAGVAARDSLDRMFQAIAIAADLYRADPAFYRTMMTARGGARLDPALGPAVREPRARFWRRQVQDAIGDGSLRQDTVADVLGVVLVQIFSGALLDWTIDAISIDELEMEISFGFAAVLLGFASKPAQADLRRRMEAWSRAIAARPRAA
jgi:AcrR family transcriptional regulator